MQGHSRTALPPAFHRIAWSNLFAQFSEQIALAAAPLVAVLLLSAGPAETGWLQTAQTLPFLLLSIPAGLLVDRSSRRMLMVGSEALRAVSLAAILGLLATALLDLPLLAGLGFLGAVGTVCYSVAAPAIVPTIVPRAQLGLTIWVPGGFLPALSFFLFGAGPILWTITTTTLRQAVTPDAMLGRVSALIMTATFGARPIGAALGAVVATRFGAQACLWVVVTGFLVQLLVICVSRVPKLKALPAAT